jgi:hypothetical protein
MTCIVNLALETAQGMSRRGRFCRNDKDGRIGCFRCSLEVLPVAVSKELEEGKEGRPKLTNECVSALRTLARRPFPLD